MLFMDQSDRVWQHYLSPAVHEPGFYARLKPWCEQHYLVCPGASTIGRMIAVEHDKMRQIPVRPGLRGKAMRVKKRSTSHHRPKTGTH
ncbi:hypothetical protein D5O23_23110 [Salmonella enterica subsp. enterica]|nr:hypothetical protein [Salmonella enterica subsp. enterica serovar Mokola]